MRVVNRTVNGRRRGIVNVVVDASGGVVVVRVDTVEPEVVDVTPAYRRVEFSIIGGRREECDSFVRNVAE